MRSVNASGQAFDASADVNSNPSSVMHQDRTANSGNGTANPTESTGVRIPTSKYNYHTQRLSGTILEHQDALADKNFNEQERNHVGGSASPNAHYHTNEPFCMTDMRQGGTNNKAHGIKCTTQATRGEKSKSSHDETGSDDFKSVTRPKESKDFDSNVNIKLLNLPAYINNDPNNFVNYNF